jgi:hypothetical protein
VTGTGPWTVTLSAPPPASTVVGDCLFDEAASQKGFLITAIDGADLTVRDAFSAGTAPSSAGAAQAYTARKYATLNAANNDLNSTTLYAAGDIAEFAMCEELLLTTYDPQNITLGAIRGLSEIRIVGHENYRHAGSVVSTARIRDTAGSMPLIWITTTVTVTVEWMVLAKVPAAESPFNSYSCIRSESGAGNLNVRHCLMYGNNHGVSPGGSGDLAGVRSSTSGVVRVSNCAIWKFNNATGSDGSGILIGGSAHSSSSVRNCTVYDCADVGIWINAGPALTVRNCIAMECGTDFTVLGSSNCSHNCSSDTTSPGGNGLTNQVLGDTLVDAPNDDLHLVPTSGAVATGMNLLGVEPDLDIDIDGLYRTGEWDRGADGITSMDSTTTTTTTTTSTTTTSTTTTSTTTTPAPTTTTTAGPTTTTTAGPTTTTTAGPTTTGAPTTTTSGGTTSSTTSSSTAAPTTTTTPAPSGVCGDATLWNQQQILAQLAEIKGVNFQGGTHSLDQYVSAADLVSQVWNDNLALRVLADSAGRTLREIPPEVAAIKGVNFQGGIHSLDQYVSAADLVTLLWNDNLALRVLANSAGRALNVLTSLGARANNANLDALLGVADQADLTAVRSMYYCRFQFVRDVAGFRDEYRCIRWYKDDTPLEFGVSSPTIRVINADTGADLIPLTALTEASNSHLFLHTATGDNRIQVGQAYAVQLRAVIDNQPRVFEDRIGRDTL